MKVTAEQIAQLIGGTIEGDPKAVVSSISKIEDGKPETMSFLANPKYEKYIYTTNASIILINNSFVAEKEIKATLIRVEDAYQSFATLLQWYESTRKKKTGIEQPSFISASAKIGENVYIGAFAYIGENATIGDNTRIYPNTYIGDNVTIGKDSLIYASVNISHDCKIGSSCVIHSGAVIGADGFGFALATDNNTKVPQLGNVIIEDEVEIGANTSIDRATLGSTIINKGVKIDNLVQIAHNVEIGANSIIVSQVGISGSAKIGKNCVFGGQVGVVGHVTVADGVKIGGQGAIGRDIKEAGAVMQGSPAIPIRNFQKSSVIFRRLPEMAKQINQLEKELKDLKEKL